MADETKDIPATKTITIPEELVYELEEDLIRLMDQWSYAEYGCQCQFCFADDNHGTTYITHADNCSGAKLLKLLRGE